MSVKSLIYCASFVGIALWWIFFLIWQPGFVHTLATISYRSTPLSVSSDTAQLARERALQYAMHGGQIQSDIYFSKDEVSHLIDVSRLYIVVSAVLNVVSVASWTVLILALAKKVNVVWACTKASYVLGAFVIVLGFCALIFNTFFEAFHRLLFPQGNWSFPASSLLIQIFPQSFWLSMVLVITLLVAVFSLLYYVLGTVRTKKY